MTPSPRVLLLVGVAGCGKTTVGRRLAEAIGWAFEDADDHHSVAARTKMSRGEGLTDADRAPWLDRLAALIHHRVEDGPPTVLACSALKASYRDRLVDGHPQVRVAWLDVPRDVIAERLTDRRGHYAGLTLLESQFGALEFPEDALRLDGTESVDDLVATLRQWLSA